jgi:outer membrane protein assembly factor BamB
VIAGGDGVLYTLEPSVGSVDENGGGPDGGDAAAPAYPRPRVVATYALGESASSPVIGGSGTTYIGTLGGKLVAVRPDGATLAWSAVTNDTSGSSPALGQDGTVYVGSSDHKLYAFTKDGASRWATDLGAEIKASPAVGGDGTIYIGTADGKLHAVNAAGNERWTYATGGPIVETPAVYAGSVYVGSQDKSLHAVSVVDGSKQWTYATLGAVATPVIGDDGTVYAGSADEHVYAVSPKGSLVFAVTVRGRVSGAGAVTPGPVFMVSTDTGLVAVGP